MKIHIALVGGQLIPVYQGILKAAPDLLFLIFSEGKGGTENQAKRLKEAWESDKGTQNIKKKIIEIKPLPNDLEDTKRKAASILKYQEIKNPDNTITLDLTGGTKIWTIGFYDTFKDVEAVNIFYTAQGDNTFFIKKKLELSFSNIDINISTYLWLQGMVDSPNFSFNDISEYNDKDLETAFTLKSLYADNSKNLGLLTRTSDLEKVIKNNPQLNHEFESRMDHNLSKIDFIQQKCDEYINKSNSYSLGKSKISWDYENSCVKFDDFSFNHSSEIVLASPKAIKLTFNHHWFEYIIANAVHNWAAQMNGFAQTILNTEIDAHKQSNNRQMALKEFDVISDLRNIEIKGQRINKPLFIECKTHLKQPTEIAKFDHGANTYGGRGCARILVSLTNLDQELIEYCDVVKLPYFSFLQQNQDLRNYDWDAGIQAFYSKLEEILAKQNA